MAQILVRVDDDLAKEVRKIVKEKYGGRRGALSLVVEEALRADSCAISTIPTTSPQSESQTLHHAPEARVSIAWAERLNYLFASPTNEPL